MELDDLKSNWQQMPLEKNLSSDVLKDMLREKTHPVLKGIRRQLMIEIAGWFTFLVVFYDFFDGHKKPFYLNLLIVGAGAFIVIHNILGYATTRNLKPDGNIVETLSKYLTRTKNYSLISITSRVLSATTLLMFLTDTIQMTREKYIMLAGIIALFAVQIGLLCRLWIKRVFLLQSVLRELQTA